MLKGKEIYLTKITEGDHGQICEWEEDYDFLRSMSSYPAMPRTEQQIASWITSMQESSNDFIFAVRNLETNNLVGVAMIDDVNWSNGVGNIALAIGDVNDRGKGYGREIMNLLLEYSFNELSLHRIALTVFSYNSNAIKLYESLGFTCEGRHREYGIRDGNRYDMLLFGILRSEWKDYVIKK